VKVGDVVYLPSGSCAMTILLTTTDGIATVMWIDKKDDEHRTTLPVEALLTEEDSAPHGKARR
jgi:uncharacterized protein YodC (DUF2158 family)